MNAKKAKKLRKAFRKDGIATHGTDVEFTTSGIKRDPVSGKLVAYGVGAKATPGRRQYKRMKRAMSLVSFK